jgi:hypothetical protein
LFSLGSAGGREKAPAAFCRKALTAVDKFEMWGDGLQTRSFTFIDECVEGVLRWVSYLTQELEILSTTVFQVVMAGKYVCTHRVEWRFLQFFCLNQLVTLMGKDNVSLGL